MRNEVSVSKMKKIRKEQRRVNEWDTFYLITGWINPKQITRQKRNNEK